jgi:hypothetical protein
VFGLTQGGLAAQQDEQTPVTEAPALIGMRTQAVTQLSVRRPSRAIADHLVCLPKVVLTAKLTSRGYRHEVRS